MASLSTSRKLSFSLVTCLGVVLLAELTLRLLGLPVGTFRMVEPGTAGLWPPNFNEVLTLGPVPYRVVANADGFRGPPLRVQAAVPRVVCIGDSMTEGFYVDNPHTYPAWMQRALDDLGFGYEALKSRNPTLVYAVATGFGPVGPHAGRKMFDGAAQAMSGICYSCGYPCVAGGRERGGAKDQSGK